jgi:hypothetical protein
MDICGTLRFTPGAFPWIPAIRLGIVDDIDKIAGELQRMGRLTEGDQLERGMDYSDEAVRMATVHTREDIILVVSYLSSIAKDVRKVRQWISALGILALVALFALVIIPGWRH